MRFKLLLVFVSVLFIPSFGEAFSVGDTEEFFIEHSYDQEGREKTEAHLHRITNKNYFYIDTEWWEDLEEERRREYERAIYRLGSEFEYNIYDKITSKFGPKPEHEVTPEDRVFVLLHPMQNGAGGYYRTGDQYSKYQYSRSNERNIVYLNSNLLSHDLFPGLLGHEFMHLITFARKTEEHGVQEEVWLNELRAEYMPTFLGYDDDFEGSNLENNVRRFLRDPDISLSEWTEQNADYGVVGLFGQYLVDHYGEEILLHSLKSSLVGIPSIDYALDKEGHDVTFSDIFTDWTVAVYVNDCSLGERYCYKNEHLQDLQITPTINVLPFTDKGSLSVDYRTKNWAGNWYRIIGGKGTLHLKLESPEEKRFEVPYVLCEKEGECEVHFFEMDDEKKGEVFIEGFNSKYESVTLIPTLQQKFSGFNGAEDSYLLRWEASIKNDVEGEKEEDMPDLQIILEKLSEIEERINNLRARILQRNTQAEGTVSCARIESNLYYGMKGSSEVRCLQEFLKNQGDHIYPEGLVTGNFLGMTKRAVIRFQEQHKKQILSPLGLSEGTGYVGKSTRLFLNSLIES